MLLILEALFVLVGLAGVAAIFWPAALILAGVAGVLACERAAAQRGETPPQGADR